MLELSPIPPIGFAYIAATTFSESFRSLQDLRNTIERYERGECQLLVWENRGFLIVSWYEENGDRWLEVEQGTGKHFYTRVGMDDLIRIAKTGDAGRIVCRAQKPLVIRLLKRLGFNFVNNQTDKMEVQIGE